MAMSGSRSLLGASDEIRDIYCEPCHQAGQVAIAEGYCVDCPEYLCGQCYKIHRRNKIMANHVLLDKDSMQVAPDTRGNVLDVCQEKCPSHPSKLTEFFCETCDKLGCHVCVTLDHRQCEKVKHIPEIVEGLEQNSELNKIDLKIKSKAGRLSKYKEKQKTIISSNNEMSELAKQELKRLRAKINRFLAELEKADDQITAIDNRNIDTMKAASDRWDHTKHDLDQIKNDLEEKNTGLKCELFIAMKRSSEKLRTLDDQLNMIQREQRIQLYTLLPSKQIEAIMRTTTEICSIATARFESEIDIDTNAKYDDPHIRLAIVRGHYCAAAEYATDDTNLIKVIDTKRNHVTSGIGIDAKQICSITSINDNQVAASVKLSGNRYQIHFFSVSASGVIQSNNQVYNVNTSYRDMVHCKGNIYGCSVNGIEILSMTGNVVRTIRTIYNDYIALCPDGQTIYVTDSHNNSVTSLTLGGKVKDVFKDKDLKHPCGIIVDKHGYVYVRSYSTKNIHQLTAALSKVHVLIKDVDCGARITYSSTEHKLYFCDCNRIHVYSLDF